jgi:hypothetical protein
MPQKKLYRSQVAFTAVNAVSTFFNAQLSRSELSLETPSMHVDRAFARLGLAWSPKKSVMLVKEPQAGADGGEYRARKVLGCAAHTL